MSSYSAISTASPAHFSGLETTMLDCWLSYWSAIAFPGFAGKTMLSLPASLSKCRSKVARSPRWICRLAWVGTRWRLQETGASVRKNSWSKEVRFEPRDALCINHRGQCSLDSGTIKKDEKYANAEIFSMNIQWHYKLSCWPLMVIPDFGFHQGKDLF